MINLNFCIIQIDLFFSSTRSLSFRFSFFHLPLVRLITISKISFHYEALDTNFQVSKAFHIGDIERKNGPIQVVDFDKLGFLGENKQV
jgi:hypothetical protein